MKPKLTKSKGYAFPHHTPTWELLEGAHHRKLVPSNVTTPAEPIKSPEKPLSKTPEIFSSLFEVEDSVRKEIEEHIVNRQRQWF